MLCQCGCGADAGVYNRTYGSKKKGDPRPYLRGHWNHRRRLRLPPPNPSGLCMCGCGRRTAIAHQTDRLTGDVYGEHRRYWRYHGGRATWRLRITPDLWSEQQRGYVSPCWIWQGRSFNQYGHGKLTMQRRIVGAHRAMYEQEVGPIPEGLEIDHLCKQPSCIRPDHLETVTHAENIRRSRLAKLDHQAVAAIRASAETYAKLAAKHGVSVSTIGAIKRHETWT